MKGQIKNFYEFKQNFLNQKFLKKKELKELYLSGKAENIKNDNKSVKKKEEKDKIIEIELSNGETIKTEFSILTKYSNSILGACINSKLSLPMRHGRVFIDREPVGFKLLLQYLENNELPEFGNNLEEKKFFSEINYWKIPMHISSNNKLKFNSEFCPHYFVLDKSKQNLKKSTLSKGIVLLNKKLTALTPYVEFTISLSKNNHNKKILLALIDEKNFEKDDIKKSFESSVPFVFYWDLLSEKVVKANKNYFNKFEFRSVDLKKFCHCYKHNKETKYGLIYNQQEHSVELIRDDVKLDILIQNIEPGLTPALEIHIENCEIQLSDKNKYYDKFFL